MGVNLERIIMLPTKFLLIRPGQFTQNIKFKIKIGDAVVEESSEVKFLGMTINNRLSWKDHIYGKGKLIANLRLCSFMIRKMKYKIPTKELFQMAQATFCSKVNYGVAVYGNVNFDSNSKGTSSMRRLQVIQNNMLRMVSSKFMKRREWGTSRLCNHYGILSRNQSAAKCILLEYWKVVKHDNHPLKDLIFNEKEIMEKPITRFRKALKIPPINPKIKRITFSNQAIKLWNMGPNEFRHTGKYSEAKRIAKVFAKTLPY